MNINNYLQKNGIVYGVSSRCFNGTWEHCDIYAFDNYESAQEWLNTEEYDFKERELCSRTKAVKYMGERFVKEAEENIIKIYNQNAIDMYGFGGVKDEI